jgi:hypothetical protein
MQNHGGHIHVLRLSATLLFNAGALEVVGRGRPLCHFPGGPTRLISWNPTIPWRAAIWFTSADGLAVTITGVQII